MKIHLASFFQTENHGSGRKIAIAPKSDNFSFKVDAAWVSVIPSQEIYDKYRELQLSDQKEAANYFVFYYNKQLEDFFEEVKSDAAKDNKDIFDLLPIKDEDTLLSWEREEFTNYRKILAEHLKDIGVDVILH
jgi:hypothetical protein